MKQEKTIAVIIDYIDSFKNTDLINSCNQKIQNLLNQINLEYFIITGNYTQDILGEILLKTKNYQTIVFFHSNMPFVFQNLTQEIITKHHQYKVDYTFAEYVPWGAAPFTLDVEVLNSIAPSLEESIYSPFTIENFLKKDLNAYDIEIVLAQKDYRFIKEPFLIVDERSYKLFEKIESSNPPLHSLEEWIEHSITYLRTSPTFVEISLTDQTSFKTIFQSPASKNPTSISFKSLERFVAQLINENPNTIIQFSLRDSDPLLYTDLHKVLDLIKQYPKIQFIIETLGYNVEEHKDTLLLLDNLKIIFYLGAVSEENYKLTNNKTGLNKLEDLVEEFLIKKPSYTYLQWVRMKENEPELPLFLERWNNYQDQIIISQYNHLAGILPDRKVVDFSPLKRFPCFHLARSLFITPQGTVALCSQDLKKEMNISIEDINWDDLYTQMGNRYKKHWEENYSELCKSCDVWYIFNL